MQECFKNNRFRIFVNTSRLHNNNNIHVPPLTLAELELEPLLLLVQHLLPSVKPPGDSGGISCSVYLLTCLHSCADEI